MSPNAMSADEMKLVARIQKLQAMADSARAVGSLAEADSFLEAVEKTLAKYNMDNSVLSIDLKNAQDPLISRCTVGSTKRHRNKPVAWAQILANNVGAAHYCSVLVSITTSHVFFYGRKSNVDVAVKMYEYLRELAERTGWKAYRHYCKTDGYMANRWYLDWLTGFAAEVGTRYAAMRVRVESNTGMSLVLTGVRKEAKDFANGSLATEEQMKNAKRTWNGAGFRGAMDSGAEAARRANLAPNVVDSTPSADRRQIR